MNNPHNLQKHKQLQILPRGDFLFHYLSALYIHSLSAIFFSLYSSFLTFQTIVSKVRKEIFIEGFFISTFSILPTPKLLTIGRSSMENFCGSSHAVKKTIAETTEMRTCDTEELDVVGALSEAEKNQKH